jgi:hypothetical protein
VQIEVGRESNNHRPEQGDQMSLPKIAQSEAKRIFIEMNTYYIYHGKKYLKKIGPLLKIS